MKVLYSGFDGLEVSVKAQITDRIDRQLHEVKAYCAENRTTGAACINGRFVGVKDHGARGGYAYICEVGQCGSKWFIKRPNKHDPWGVRVSASSAALAANGIDGFRQYIDEVSKMLEFDIEEGGVSITRVDFAVDILAPDFVLDRNHVVAHARSGVVDHGVEEVSSHGRSSRITSVTVGKMPGRQMILYDKREEVMVKRKWEWLHIWAQSLEMIGHAPIDFNDPVASRVWRIEARSGKDHLQGKWKVKGWGLLFEHLPAMFEDSFAKVRYCAFSHDTNRARWQTHPIWQLAEQAVQDGLKEFQALASLEDIVEMQKDEVLELLERQLGGIAISHAALSGVSATRLLDHFILLARRMEMRLRHHRKSPEERLEAARGRFSRFEPEP